jgi:hypothetical protein
MDEKSPNSIKPSIQKLLDSYKPLPISELTIPPRRAYSPHPRVQRTFKKLLILREQREREPGYDFEAAEPTEEREVAPAEETEYRDEFDLHRKM